MKKSILLALLTALVFMLFFDQEVAHFFHAHHFALFRAITTLGNAAIWLIPSLILWIYYKKRAPSKAKKALFLFGSVALSGIIVDILKPLIGRARPKHLFNEGFYGFDPLTFKASFWSMPSGHSATAFAAGVALALLYPRYRALFIFGAALVAFSRVALTKHYPSDIIIGSLIGALTALWLYGKIKV